MLHREHAPLVEKHLAEGGVTVRGYLVALACSGVFVVGIAVWTFLSGPS
jgi:hypothetical protein